MLLFFLWSELNILMVPLVFCFQEIQPLVLFLWYCVHFEGISGELRFWRFHASLWKEAWSLRSSNEWSVKQRDSSSNLGKTKSMLYHSYPLPTDIYPMCANKMVILMKDSIVILSHLRMGFLGLCVMLWPEVLFSTFSFRTPWLLTALHNNDCFFVLFFGLKNNIF